MNKTKIILSIALAFFTSAIIAQEIHFGPKVGFNLSNVYDTEDADYNAEGKIGLAAGAFLQIPMGSFIGFHPELLFSQKGFKASGSILGNNYTYTRTLNYIDVPLLIAFKPTEIFTIVAGPQYSYLMSSKNVFDNSFLNIEQEREFDNTNLRKNTLGFLGGFDVNLNQIVIGARVGWDILHNNGDGSSTDPRYKNVWYQATIGFRL